MMRWAVLGLMAGSALGQVATGAKPVESPIFPGGEGTALGRAVAGVLADPEVARAHVGVAVTAMDGTPLFGVHEGQLFRPASNAKLFTTAAAMAVLGPAKTASTTVLGNLKDGGVVEGDLILKGGGDATFGTADVPFLPSADRSETANAAPALKDLEELADKLVAKGVKHVHGGVVGDDTLFPWEPYAAGWEEEDLLWGYGAPVSALSVADNQLKLTIRPGTITGPKGHESFRGGEAALDDHGVPYYDVRSEVSVTKAGTGSHANVEWAKPRALRVYGTMAVDAPPDAEEIAVEDPALYAARALETMLKKRGVDFGDEAESKHRPVHDGRGFLSALLQPPTGCEDWLVAKNGACGGSCARAIEPPELARHTSLSLDEDVKYTLKVSQNLHAELMLHRLGLQVFCGQGSTVEGARVVRAFLLHAGLDGNDFMFYDGSGLSTKDLVTPRATTRLLTYAAMQPWFPMWKAALPVGGVDGSLASRYKDGPLKGRVFAKTGTLGESRALSGYVECASGRTVAFSIFVDTHLPGHSEGDVIDRIVAAIAAEE